MATVVWLMVQGWLGAGAAAGGGVCRSGNQNVEWDFLTIG